MNGRPRRQPGAPAGRASRGRADARTLDADEYRDFCRFLEDACGIVLGDNKQYLVASRLSRLMDESGIASLGELVRRLRSGAGPLRERTIEAMTTNETSWFRDNHPFRALREKILPELARAQRNPVRIWSAACSTGQEPYSISMTVHDLQQSRPGLLPGPVQIVATDISTEVLKVARQGRYDGLSMARGLGGDRRERFFRPVGDEWEVRPEIRARVQFRPLNLLQSYALLGRFDVIFCRNVLIYFSTDSKRDILERMARTLNPGGYLLLGGSESITGLSDAFALERYAGGVVYRLR